MSRNQVDKGFLSQLNQPVYRSIIDINTYHLDRFVGVNTPVSYTTGVLFQRLDQSFKKQNSSYKSILDNYTLVEYDYGSKLDSEEISSDQFRITIFSYTPDDSRKITNLFSSLPYNISSIHSQNQTNHDPFKKRQLVPLVFQKFIKDRQNLVSLDFRLRKYAITAINHYLSAVNFHSDLTQDQRELSHIICVLLTCLIVETNMCKLYHELTGGNIEKKTLGQMMKKTFNVDKKRKKKFFIGNLFSDLQHINTIRIRTVHPTINPLHFPDDPLTSLFVVGKFVIRCDEYGI